MPGLPDLEGLFNEYLAARWDGQTSLDDLERRWSETPSPDLEGLSPRAYLAGKTPAELAEMLSAYTRSEELGIPELLRRRLLELGAPAHQALWDLVQESRRTPAAGSKENLVPVVALEVLAEACEPALLPNLLNLLLEEAAAGRALLVPPLVSALAGLGEEARPALLAALRHAEAPARLPLARALAALLPHKETRQAVLDAAGEVLPAHRAAWAELLPAAGGGDAIPLLLQWAGEPTLDLPAYRVLAEALRHLGQEPPARPDLIETTAHIGDAQILFREGQALLSAGNAPAAERLLERAAALDAASPWPCLELARARRALPRPEEASASAAEACRRAEDAWQHDPRQDYALTESILHAADIYLGDPGQRREERWRHYARGALALYGVLNWGTLAEILDLAVEVPWQFTPPKARQLLQHDPETVAQQEYAAGKQVEDAARILAARPPGLEPKPWSLSAFKLAAEGEWERLLPPEEEVALRAAMNALSPAAGLSAAQISLALRNAADPADAFRRLSANLPFTPPGLFDALRQLWPLAFRWELLGWSPAELARGYRLR